MQKCVSMSKEQLDYIFLTKETRDEFLKVAEPLIGNYIKSDDGKTLVVCHDRWASRIFTTIIGM